MWTISNKTPFAAERCWVRDKQGAEVWLVAVKGTFLIDGNGRLELAEEQEEVHMAPRFVGEDAFTSLVYDSDLPHCKSATDVLLNGRAYAPGGRPTTSVDVTLRLGPIDKTLRIFGDRRWTRSAFALSMSPAEPFVTMPLTYERAFGGADRTPSDAARHDWEPRNPVGTGFATRESGAVDRPAPNIEYPRALIRTWRDRPPPAGFGPIAGHWSPRVDFAGSYDQAWERRRQPLLPEDFDERFHQCAPLDQQVPGFLRGGELAELRNLTPSGVLRFRLPRVDLRLQTLFTDGERREHATALHTVVLEPDVPRVMLVWHSHLPCHHKVTKLRTTRILFRRRIDTPQAEVAAGIWTAEAQRA